MVKNLPAMEETWVQSLSHEDPLEKGMVTHSSILAYRISWTEKPGGLQSMGSQSDTTETNTVTTIIKDTVPAAKPPSSPGPWWSMPCPLAAPG